MPFRGATGDGGVFHHRDHQARITGPLEFQLRILQYVGNDCGYGEDSVISKRHAGQRFDSGADGGVLQRCG